jgi:signal transduction histidine kinase
MTTNQIDALNAEAWQLCDSNRHSARRIAERARECARSSGYLPGEARSNLCLAQIALEDGDLDGALAFSAPAQRFAETSAHPALQLDTQVLLARIALQRGAVDAAVQHYQAAAALALTLQRRDQAAALFKRIGGVRMHNGMLREALEAYTESLRLVEHAHNQRDEASLLNNMGSLCSRLGDTAAALEYLRCSMAIRRALADKQGLVHTLNNLGLVYENTGMYSDALVCYGECLQLAHDLGDAHSEACAHSNMGVVHQQMGDYPRAFECFFKSLTIAQASNNQESEANCLNNIAQVFVETNDFASALEHLKKSLTLHQALGDKSREAIALGNIGGVYHRARDYRMALTYLLESLAISRALADEHTTANTLCDIGSVHLALEDCANAIAVYQQSLDLARALHARRREAEALLGIGTAHVHSGALDEALLALNQALACATQLGAKDVLYKTHARLSQVYEAQGGMAEALHHQRVFHDIKEEVYNAKSDETLRKLQAIHGVENARREAEIYRLKNVELAHLNATLNKLINEKNELLSIAAHDLRNPLTVISSITGLIEADPANIAPVELDDHMKTIAKTVDRMLEIITNLLTSNAIEQGLMTLRNDVVDLGQMAHSAVADFTERAQHKAIVLEYQQLATRTLVVADTSATRQILDNLLSNAVKYSPAQTRVTVRVRDADAFVRFEVRDQGPGLTDDDKQRVFGKFARLSAKPTGGEHSTGLGLSIVKSLAERMGARVVCQSQAGHGATFAVEFARAHALEPAVAVPA